MSFSKVKKSSEKSYGPQYKEMMAKVYLLYSKIFILTLIKGKETPFSIIGNLTWVKALHLKALNQILHKIEDNKIYLGMEQDLEGQLNLVKVY